LHSFLKLGRFLVFCCVALSFKVQMSTIREATFRHQYLTTDKAEILLAQLHNLKALNLSQNKIDALPRGIPLSLIALDLSFNSFSTFPISERLHNLIELKLSNNNIESTAGLDAAVSLEYLDLSNNRIRFITGIFKNLKTLQLGNNAIATSAALRSLSLNSVLSDLVLKGNPICDSKNYKTLVLGFVLSLKKLDGKLCKNRIKNDKKAGSSNYRDGYLDRRSSGDMSSFDDAISKNNNLERSRRLGDESIYIDGWSSASTNGNDSYSPVTVRSPVPWRNPPTLLPRDRKGNPLFGVTGEYTSR